MASTFNITSIVQVSEGVWNVSFYVKTNKAEYPGNVYQWQLAAGDTVALNSKVQGIVSYLESQESAVSPALPAAFAALVPAALVEPTIGA
jgi:hypothetical protein